MAGQPHSGTTRSGFRRRRSVAWASFTVHVTGVALGVAGGLAATGLAAGPFSGAARADPVTYLLAVPGPVTLTLMSTCTPAHSATRIDPLVSLRDD